jgi:hypothetical protein
MIKETLTHGANICTDSPISELIKEQEHPNKDSKYSELAVRAFSKFIMY